MRVARVPGSDSCLGGGSLSPIFSGSFFGGSFSGVVKFSRVACLALAFATIVSCASGVRAQWTGAAVDKHELVTGKTEILVTPEQRQSVVNLLAAVQHNFSVTMSAHPYTMKVSFKGSGDTQYEGEGTMLSEEALPNWKWSAQVAGVTPTRMMAGGKVYGSADAVPLRVQMVREALFRPVPGAPGQKAIRVADAEFGGKKLTCALLSGDAPQKGLARQWWDREYCVEPSTGLLMVASEAAGVYAEYDYSNGVDFHGHMLPGQITFYQGEKTVLEIRLESVTDGVENAQNEFGAAAVAALTQPTFLMASGQWTPMRVDENPHGELLRIEPVFVHATVSNDTGKVLEAEAVGNSDLSARAVELVKQTGYEPTGFQRDLYVAVEFFVRQ
jgi:hypothetical protein